MLFDDHFTMVLCMTITMLASFFFSMCLILLFPGFYAASLLIGLWIGWRFGTLLKHPAPLNGVFNGLMGGAMGTMLGAVLQNPALCRIPVESAAAIDLYTIPFAAACFHACILLSIRYSLRM
ncbi:hypothetical protein RRU94_23010 [Domibacillus sp. DTU_2020_1001157_1_SI_ALB_TIR_016]|uniref:hypothetical protein n=1 Tax=Domibacillus sp. DTU_2020_1001157_1_SI_ALB_TIR_016 TaxID=3077789 RepID=UPI0028E35644|nr:hypothetical protein [Domibacillus sp. DTU_2020_1001157_1_SI_ALB_TIR_016]WNS80349.1 hypothetical protein RRU94_23010 [Domibacillus sp. DTU_2020_1001157_1_SI_ALB_TIR_016]